MMPAMHCKCFWTRCIFFKFSVFPFHDIPSFLLFSSCIVVYLCLGFGLLPKCNQVWMCGIRIIACDVYDRPELLNGQLDGYVEIWHIWRRIKELRFGCAPAAFFWRDINSESSFIDFALFFWNCVDANITHNIVYCLFYCHHRRRLWFHHFCCCRHCRPNRIVDVPKPPSCRCHVPSAVSMSPHTSILSRLIVVLQPLLGHFVLFFPPSSPFVTVAGCILLCTKPTFFFRREGSKILSFYFLFLLPPFVF